MIKWLAVFILTLLVFVAGTAPVRAVESLFHGPYSAIEMDPEIVKGITTENGDIYVRISRPYRDRSFVVKISDEYLADYRQWLNGDSKMPVRVYRSKDHDKQGCTYRINTTARYVEYWMNGDLILHLRRTD